MECGTEIDLELTKELESLGFPVIGTLIEYGDQMFHVMGYHCWCWDFVLDVKHDPREFYDIILYHIGTAMCSSFPYMRVIEAAMIVNDRDQHAQ